MENFYWRTFFGDIRNLLRLVIPRTGLEFFSLKVGRSVNHGYAWINTMLCCNTGWVVVLRCKENTARFVILGKFIQYILTLIWTKRLRDIIDILFRQKHHLSATHKIKYLGFCYGKLKMTSFELFSRNSEPFNANANKMLS